MIDILKIIGIVVVAVLVLLALVISYWFMVICTILVVITIGATLYVKRPWEDSEEYPKWH